jgi:CHAD domain-containing protein
MARPGKPNAGMNCQRAFQQIARECLGSVRKHRAAACRGNPEAIHQIRIALTKLRAARKFFAAMTRDTAWPKLKAEIRRLNAVLGAARDSDVTTARAGHAGEGPLPARESKKLAGETSRTHRRLATALRSARYDKLLAALARWIDRGPWLTMGAVRRRTRRLADYAPPRLQRWRRRLARKAARGLGDGRRRHRLRIAAKRYRYMSELLVAMGMPESRAERRSRKAAQAAQHILGNIRDLRRLREFQSADDAARSHRRNKRLLRRAAKALRGLG